MDVEKLPYYGAGIVETLSSPEYKRVEKQMMLPAIHMLRKETGWIGLVKLLIQWFSEEKKMRQHPWDSLIYNKVPREVFELTFQLIALMKVLESTLSTEKAKGVITRIFEKTEEKLAENHSDMNLFLYPIQDLKMCKDRFLCFKKYTRAMELTGVKDKFHKAEITEDTKDTFAFHVHYCTAHEVAKAYGKPAWCFPWCELDEVVFPRMGLQLGFRFKRSSSLSTGAPKCDFRFERLTD